MDPARENVSESGKTPAAGDAVHTPEGLQARRQARRDRRRSRRRRGVVGLLVLLSLGGAAVVLLSLGSGGQSGQRRHDRRSAASSVKSTTTLRSELHLPRGGRTLLPGHLVVAYSRIVGTSNILGQTGDPEADAAGVERVVQRYARLGEKVQPAFESVATIASSDPGPQGTYSLPVGHATIERCLRVAHRDRLLLILDFQPGRGAFLPGVKHDARFLRDPSVGVALDPEWKLTADQVPDEVIGSASATAINAVSSYLSALVRHDRLPQKLFIVHRFRPSELPDRRHVAFRRDLAVLQMDGLGPVTAKLAAYRQVMRGAKGLFPGFELFLQRSADPGFDVTPAGSRTASTPRVYQLPMSARAATSRRSPPSSEIGRA